MIVLVNPMWSVEHLNKDSNYVHIKKVLERYTQLYPDTYFIIPFPSKFFKYYEDGFFDNKNIIRVPYVVPLAKKVNNITFDGNFFKYIVERYGISLIYNQIPEVTGQLKCLDSHYSSNLRVVNQHHYIYHDSLPYPLDNQMQYVYWQIVGDVLADVNIYNSKYTMKMVLENTSKYMPNFMTEIKDKAKVIYMGLYNKNDLVANKKFDTFTFVYNHRLQQYKNWETTFELFDKLAKKHDFNVALCPVGPSNITPINKKPYTRVFDCKTQKEYYEVLSKCHANTFNTQYETFCISIFESMMLGLATIVPNNTTMPELLGRNNMQLFYTKQEQYDKVESLLKDHEQAEVLGLENQRKAAKFNIDTYCKELHEIFVEQHETLNMYETLRPRNKDKLNAYLTKSDSFTIDEMKRIRRNINLSNQSVPNHRLVNIMYHAGFDQIIEKDQVVFLRKT
jgi:glycosyltransferase involved in cell wall biosynthesis